MSSNQADPALSLMLDGNAAGGILNSLFGGDVTASTVHCARCGREGAVGTLRAFMQAPGVVLRCPRCDQVILRVARVPGGFYLDMRGTVYLHVHSASTA